jgi:ribosome modulation factor
MRGGGESFTKICHPPCRHRRSRKPRSCRRRRCARFGVLMWKVRSPVRVRTQVLVLKEIYRLSEQERAQRSGRGEEESGNPVKLPRQSDSSVAKEMYRAGRGKTRLQKVARLEEQSDAGLKAGCEGGNKSVTVATEQEVRADGQSGWRAGLNDFDAKYYRTARRHYLHASPRQQIPDRSPAGLS